MNLPTNIRLGWEGSPGSNYLSYPGTFVNYGRKMFYNIDPRRELLINKLAFDEKVISSDKHASLPRYRINYGRKKFYRTGPNVIKLLTAVIYEYS